MTLALVIEDGADPRLGPDLHRRMVSRPSFEWLRPPDMSGVTTVLDVLEASDPAAHERAVLAWGADVWGAWAAHHETVRAWLKTELHLIPAFRLAQLPMNRGDWI